MNFVIEFYRTTTGQRPISKYIKTLNPNAYAKTLRMMELLRSKGPDIGMPYSKSLGKGLFELRVHDKQSVRLFYVFSTKQRILILHAFTKKTQKTPLKELITAKNRQKQLTSI